MHLDRSTNCVEDPELVTGCSLLTGEQPRTGFLRDTVLKSSHQGLPLRSQILLRSQRMLVLEAAGVGSPRDKGETDWPS